MRAYTPVGQPFTYQIAALHAPTGFAATGLSKGLTINTTTGEITGTPTEAGIHSISLGATNTNGTGKGTLTLMVTAQLPKRPVVTSPATASGRVGVPFTYQIAATNKPTHYFVTAPGARGTVPPASSLPAGLTYDSTTGLLSGTPKAAGTYPLQLAAMNESGIVCSLITLTVIDK
jgi:PKD repeat protein